MRITLECGGRLAVVTAAALIAGCSTTHPWLNAPLPPLAETDVGSGIGSMPTAGPKKSPSVITAVALSGGGARAAAFGLGVLEEMKATRIEVDGRKTTLLDEVELISGVSGGSILASYYAAFGDETFTRFEPDFLDTDFQSRLIGYALAPVGSYRLSSPWYGRSNALEDRLGSVFRGLTFGDLKARGRGPRLLVTATDLTTGAPFEFTPEQFALICSDLDSVPLSFAVAASSSVPVLLSPMTLRNYAGSCPQSDKVYDEAMADRNLAARLLRMIAKSYHDSGERPYLHLVDGGLADNLGVRGLLDHVTARGSLRDSFVQMAPGSVHRVVLVSVNSERDLGERLDDDARVPNTGQVLDALVFGAGSRATAETSAMVVDAAQRLARELAADRGSAGSPFAADAELFVIGIRLRDAPDGMHRRELLQVPTALTISPGQVHDLREAGRRTLRASPEFQDLLRSLTRLSSASAANGVDNSTR